MTTNRQAQKNYADKMRRKGFKRMTIWIPEDETETALAWAEEQRRQFLRNKPKPSN